MSLIIIIFVLFLGAFVQIAANGSFNDETLPVVGIFALFFIYATALYLERRDRFNRFRIIRPSKSWRGSNTVRRINKYCDLNYISSIGTITCKELTTNTTRYRTFKVVKSKYPLQERWKMMCDFFSEGTNYNALVALCTALELEIKENVLDTTGKDCEMIDINNASIADIASLPGISVIMAKKAVKRRESIGGFKTIGEFFKFLRIKPNMQKQIELLICVNTMKPLPKIEKSNERNVDL